MVRDTPDYWKKCHVPLSMTRKKSKVRKTFFVAHRYSSNWLKWGAIILKITKRKRGCRAKRPDSWRIRCCAHSLNSTVRILDDWISALPYGKRVRNVSDRMAWLLSYGRGEVVSWSARGRGTVFGTLWWSPSLCWNLNDAFCRTSGSRWVRSQLCRFLAPSTWSRRTWCQQTLGGMPCSGCFFEVYHRLARRAS